MPQGGLRETCVIRHLVRKISTDFGLVGSENIVHLNILNSWIYFELWVLTIHTLLFGGKIDPLLQTFFPQKMMYILCPMFSENSLFVIFTTFLTLRVLFITLSLLCV